jgi:hypothetical protein
MNTIVNRKRTFKFFVPGAPKTQVAFKLVEFLKIHKDLNFPNVILVLHNGDFFPSKLEISNLSRRFHKVYSVNWIGQETNVIPIPIGLENQGLLSNGVLRDFLTLGAKAKPVNDRKYKILACFSIHTNPKERHEALYHAKQLQDCLIVEKPITPRNYRQLLLNSQFIISPPGNGIDCHRTWEAMFLGAIPIVKKSFWPFGIYPMQVRTIESWDKLQNFNHQITEDPQSSFYQTFAKVDYWMSQ